MKTRMDALFRIDNLSKIYRNGRQEQYALKNVSLDVETGETLGIIGKSGSGKTTLARLLVRLERPDEGKIYFKNNEIQKFKREQVIKYCKEVQMVFQNPYAALDPALSIAASVEEGMMAQGISDRNERRDRMCSLLASVGIDPDECIRKPRSFSGGQLQRICIARALASDPKVLILDEPTSALDVSIRASVINLLTGLRKIRKFTMIFIGHDLRLIRYVSDHIAVLNHGELIEYGETEDICLNPKQSYTRSLFSEL